MAHVNVLERMKSHYRDQLEAGLKSIDVAELGDETGPLKIYFQPMTLEQQGRVYKAMKSDDLDFMAQSLIERARHEDGERMFKNLNKLELRKHVDGNLIQELVARMNEELASTEDAEKN